MDENIVEFKNHILSKDMVPGEICNILSNKVIDLEKTILSLGVSNYKETPEHTITTRHQYYNLLDFLGEDLKLVSKKIAENCNRIIGGKEFYVKMWANIFRNGECIRRHMHHASPIIEHDAFRKNVFKTICGNLFVYGDQNSETIYHLNEPTAVKNEVGDMHFFSCITEHETKPYSGNLRISIAFDMYTRNFFPEIGMMTPSNLRLISL